MKKIEVTKKTAGDLIQYCRIQAGMNQQDLSAISEVPMTSICKYEKHRTEPVYSRFVYLVGCCGYNVTLTKQGKTFIELDDLKEWRANRIANDNEDMQALDAWIDGKESYEEIVP